MLGIDCEMVYAKDDKDALARVSVVSCSGVIYDAGSSKHLEWLRLWPSKAHVQKKKEDVRGPENLAWVA